MLGLRSTLAAGPRLVGATDIRTDSRPQERLRPHDSTTFQALRHACQISVLDDAVAIVPCTTRERCSVNGSAMNTVRKSMQAVRHLNNYVFHNIPVDISSAYSLQESVRRLSDVTKRNLFAAMFSFSPVVGRVTAAKVRLTRARLFIPGIFGPVFIGKFVERDGRVTLLGRFTLSLLGRIVVSYMLWFMIIWEAFVTFTALGVLLELIRTHAWTSASAAIFFPFAGIAFLVMFIQMVRFGWSESKVEFLTGMMTQALSR
jgi:hypothetical protein